MTNFDLEIKQYGQKNNVPITLDDTLTFLIETIKKFNSKQILEIGTAIGYGCINIAKLTDVEHVDTIELNNTRYTMAVENIKKHNLQDKITIYNMDAKDFLNSSDNKYDLIYLDGPKGQYPNYLKDIIRILNDGGIIFADNLHFHGMVNGKTEVSKGCRALVKGLTKYIEIILSDDRLDSRIYDIGDGVGISILKNKLYS